MHGALADVKTLDADPTAFWLGGWHSINVIVWTRAATSEVIQRFERALVERARTYPKTSSIHIVAASARPPEPAAKDELVAVNERLADNVACGAVVIERGGIAGVALRSAITGIIILAPKQYRIKVFDGLEPCAPWVVEQHAKRTGIEFEAAAVLEVLRHCRSIAGT